MFNFVCAELILKSPNYTFFRYFHTFFFVPSTVNEWGVGPCIWLYPLTPVNDETTACRSEYQANLTASIAINWHGGK